MPLAVCWTVSAPGIQRLGVESRHFHAARQTGCVHRKEVSFFAGGAGDGPCTLSKTFGLPLLQRGGAQAAKDMGGLFSTAEVPHADERAAPLLARGLAKELRAPLGAAIAGLCS